MTIPASRIVTINPGVISAGGTPLALNGLFLTQNPLMPTKTVLSFVSSTSVGNFFGLASDEYALALIYFSGFINSTIKPSAMLFAAYNAASRSAFLQSASFATISLAELQAVPAGVLTISVDGVSKTSTSIDLSAATSFSNAATLIAAGFTGAGAPTVAWNPVNSTFTISSSTTGTASSLSYATGTLAFPLGFDMAEALLSQGALADTPATAMQNAISKSQNFATIVPMFEPVIADKTNFAVWVNGQNNRYQVVIWDTDPNAVVQGNLINFGVLAKTAEYNGVICISGDPALAASTNTALSTLVRNCASFYSGAVASINFSQTNGRITTMFRSSASINPTCDDDQISQNLLANGYNYYGSYATAAQNFIFFANGQVPGEWTFSDPYLNQIFLNSQFQVALLTLLTQIGSVPYNPNGYGLVRASLLDPINAAINFGSIRTGVTLSQQQIAELNQAAGLDISSVIQTQGWYLQILDPGADVRAVRGTPVINFWYTDGDAIQQITMASIDIL